MVTMRLEKMFDTYCEKAHVRWGGLARTLLQSAFDWVMTFHARHTQAHRAKSEMSSELNI